MSEMSSQQNPPSTTRIFLRGFGSGAFNSALLMGILFGLTKAVSLIGVLGVTAPVATAFFATAAVATVAIGLFSGIMAVKDTLFASNNPTHDRRHTRDTIVPVPVVGMSSPAITPSFNALPDAAESTATKNWVSQTNRSDASQTRIQQILADGALNDKARARAILAERDAASQDTARTV